MMKKAADNGFEGFSPEALRFLTEVRSQNSKQWFEEHRPEYQRCLLGPMQAFVRELGGFMLTVDPQLEVRPAVGKTISRIFRDTRFSRDKSLFRDCLWFSFKRSSRDWEDTPGYFFEINPGGCSYGMGFYLTSRETMAAFRSRIAARPEQFRAAIAPLREGSLRLEGELYKRPPQPNGPDDLRQWTQRKNFYLVRDRAPDATLFSGAVADEVISEFERVVPLYHYLWETISLKGVSS